MFKKTLAITNNRLAWKKLKKICELLGLNENKKDNFQSNSFLYISPMRDFMVWYSFAKEYFRYL